MLIKLAPRLGFACALLAAVACGSDSDSNAPQPPSATAGTSAAAAAGSTGAGDVNTAAPPAGEAAPGESPGDPLDDSPIDGTAAASGGTSVAPGASAGGVDGGAPIGAGGGATAPAGGSPFPSDVTRPRIMIVGDSISAGPGCYKKFLLADLNAGGYTNFDFVGQYTDDCGGGVMHSARSCTTALDYTQPTFTLRDDCGGGEFPGLATLMTTHQPNLLMLQLGVNDVWNGVPTDTILANYGTLFQQARAANPNIVIAIAEIQQIRPTSDGDAVFARAQQLIEALPAWAAAQSQPTSPVFVADLWTNSDTTQTLDGVHPDDPGAERMGGNWFETLKNILPHD